MNIELVATRYKIIRELGRGGMGVVYVVEHVHTGEHLALKVLHGAAASDPGAKVRFKREARVGAQIKSDHVVRVTDADVAPELGGAPFFVMELLDGLDLEKLVSKVGPLHPSVVMTVLSQAARALDKAHGLGIVHRDLKPENIFLHRRDDDTVITKVLDFGISKFLSADDKRAAIGATTHGTLMGTPYYMAPEQARGDVDLIGPATDVWSVGLVALRLLTAELYWTATTQAELLVQILVAPMRRPSERWPSFGPGLDSWFLRSCDRDPSTRWGSVSEQIKALGEVLNESMVQADGKQAGGADLHAVTQVLRDSAATTSRSWSMATQTAAPMSPGGRSGQTVSVAEFTTSSPGDAIRGTTSGAGSFARTTPGTKKHRRSRAIAGVVAFLVLGVLALVFFLKGRPEGSVASTSFPSNSVGSAAVGQSSAVAADGYDALGKSPNAADAAREPNPAGSVFVEHAAPNGKPAEPAGPLVHPHEASTGSPKVDPRRGVRPPNSRKSQPSDPMAP